MTRLVKTTVEMEGRYGETWVLVDDADGPPAWDEAFRPTQLGRPTPRIDGVRRVGGAARYTVDVVLAGMLHAAVLRSPVAHGRVRRLDLEAAPRAPGVRAAVGPGDAAAVEGAWPLVAEPQYVGQPIAVVAADSRAAARAGVAALALDVEPLPFTWSLEEGLREQRFTEDPQEEARGDVDAALAGAEVRVELACETPGHLQTALEPHAAVAWWQADELTVWVSTQGMFAARDELARSFGLPRERVRVVTEYVGGGFGAKQGAGPEGLLAAELSRRTGRPVRLVLDRHAEQLDGGHRGATRQSVRLGAHRDGTLVAVDADALCGQGVGGLVMPVLVPAMTLYRCADARATTFPIRLNLRAQNAFRAPGVMEGTAVFEQAMDELAEALALDPLELRRRNHVAHDQESGNPYSTKELLACYDRAAELSGWEDRDRLRGPQPDGLLRGMGCASQIWWGGGGPPAHATVRMAGDGVATVTTGIQDIGTGTLTAAQIVAAEELGLPLARVRVTGGDTRPNVYGPVSGGSATVPSVMPAVRAAAHEVRRTLLRLAGDVFEASPDDLELVDGRFRSRDGALDRPLDAVTGKLGDATIDGSGSRGPNPEGLRVHTFGCQVAQVAVDPGLGRVVVERVWAVHDVGRIVNPLGASSQAEGGILQGIGFALFEERVVDPTTGAPTNASLDDYKLPTIADVPEIVVEFVNRPDVRLSHVGAKGLGEPPIIPTAAAIANGFRHATGRRCAALPMTPARVLEALR